MTEVIELIDDLCWNDYRDRDMVITVIKNSAGKINPIKRYAKDNIMSELDVCNLIYQRNILEKNAWQGWIDPEGVMWGCDYANHLFLSHLLTPKNVEISTEEYLENKGWVKVSDLRYYANGPTMELNEAQATTLVRIHEERIARGGPGLRDGWS